MAVPDRGRLQLEWHVFDFDARYNRWHLVLPEFYSGLFAHKLPYVFKCCSGFQPTRSKNKNKRFNQAYLYELDNQSVYQVRQFIETYGLHVCLGKSKIIRDFFNNEIDGGLALGVNFDLLTKDRTHYGKMEYEAKYKGKVESQTQLVTEMAEALKWVPGLDCSREFHLTHVPDLLCGRPSLTLRLARGIEIQLKRKSSRSISLLDASLKSKKWTLKNLAAQQKADAARQLYGPDNVEFGKIEPTGQIVIVDDLYQSGASIWSFASTLKQLGYNQVFALAAVKSLRDSGNV